MKLGLGTVLFGLDYGIANTGGQTPLPEVRRILALATEAAVAVLDTAVLYGESEAAIGRALPARHGFKVVSKTPSFGGSPIRSEHEDEIEAAFSGSLERLGLTSVYALLIHHAADVLAPGGERLLRRAETMKERGAITKIGVSAYGPAEIEAILDRHPIDIIQVPLNVLDQRLLTSGLLQRLKRADIEVHARSVFLQGALLMPPERLPAHFAPARSRLVRYHKMRADFGLSSVEAPIDFVRQSNEIDCLIVGVDSCEQLRQAIAAFGAGTCSRIDYQCFAVDDERIVEPRWWPDSR